MPEIHLHKLQTKHPGDHAELRAPIYKIRQISTRPRSGDPNLCFISETSKSVSVHSRSLEKVHRVKEFRVNVLKGGSIYS